MQDLKAANCVAIVTNPLPTNKVSIILKQKTKTLHLDLNVFPFHSHTFA